MQKMQRIKFMEMQKLRKEGYMRFKFGDIIENGYESIDNPRRKGFFVKKVKWYLDTFCSRCRREGEFEVNYDATQEEIEELVKEEGSYYVSWSWKIVKED